MATKRPKDETATTSIAADDVVMIDGTTNGTRGILAALIANLFETTLTDGTTIATDASVGTRFKVTLGGNRTLGAPSNLQAGTWYTWRFTQDGTGNRTLAYNAVFKFPGGTAPVLQTAAGAEDVLLAYCDGTNLLAALSTAALATIAFVANALATSALRVNSQSADYTLVLADNNGLVYHPSSDTTARTFTIPANSSVAYPVGAVISFFNDTSAGTVTVAITSDTMVQANAGTTGSISLLPGHSMSIVKLTSTRWMANLN